MPAWKQFQKETNSNIVLEHGVLLFGHEGDQEFEVIAQNARDRDGHDRNVLSATTLRKQYPLFRTPDDGLGVFDEQGGAVRSEMAVYSAVHGAQKLGAEVHTDTKVHGGPNKTVSLYRDREFVVENWWFTWRVCRRAVATSAHPGASIVMAGLPCRIMDAYLIPSSYQHSMVHPAPPRRDDLRCRFP